MPGKHSAEHPGQVFYFPDQRAFSGKQEIHLRRFLKNKRGGADHIFRVFVRNQGDKGPSPKSVNRVDGKVVWKADEEVCGPEIISGWGWPGQC